MRTGVEPSVDASHERFDLGPHVLVQHRKLAAGGLDEADAAREPVDAQRRLPEQGGERAAQGAQSQLQLKCAILGLRKAKSKPGVIIGPGLDVGDTVSVALQANGPSQAVHADAALDSGQTAPEGDAQDVLKWRHQNGVRKCQIASIASVVVKPSSHLA